MTYQPGLTKADFARVMGVDRSQPTQWAKRGMPMLPDGLVDAPAAAEWVRSTVDNYARTRRSVGARQVREGQHAREELALDDYVRLGLRLFALQIPLVAAKAAVEAGVPMAQVFALHRALLATASDTAAEVATEFMGLAPGERPPTDPDLIRAPWEALAAAAGEPVDLAAWQTYAAARQPADVAGEESAV